MHKCIICIGSNYNRKENLLLARKRLADLFPSIRFTTERETQPLFFRSPALFSNQVALFFSEAEEEKELEMEAVMFSRKAVTNSLMSKLISKPEKKTPIEQLEKRLSLLAH